MTTPSYIVCPVRNCLQLTRAAIDSFLAQDIGDVCVFVINNDSRDGTAQYLASLYPQVHAIHYAPAKGVTYVWNRALEYLFDTVGVPYVLVANNDVELRPDTYRLLVHDGGGFVTAVGVHERDKALLPSPTPEPISRRPHPDFSCFLIRRETWQKVGAFDESMVLFAQDNSYHVRMHRAGIRAECLDLPFYHVGGGSQTVKTALDDEQKLILAQADKDRETFRQMYGCLPGTPEYTMLFDEASFGVDAHMTGMAQPR